MLLPSTLLAALCIRLASAATGHVYIYDGPNSEPTASTPSRSLSPVQARLVLAQRAGVEDFHSLDLQAGGVVEAINDFGRRTSLFEEDEVQKAFLLVEGIAEPEVDMPQLSAYRSFDLSPAPDAVANGGLWIDLARQGSPKSYPSSMTDERVAEILQSTNFIGKGANCYIAKDMSDFETTFNSLLQEGKHAITAYITPPTHSGSSDEIDQWGTYSMPTTQSPLRKRSARSPQKEEPLELHPTTSYAPVQSSSAPLSSLADSSAPLRGILPACFPTLSACESTTRNCTGHGSCSLAYTDAAADSSSPSKNCYSCSCSASVQTTEDGKTKTTYWGGPACQKKDVSVQFWLLALFSVGMVFLVGFAIGEIGGMGGEELPSVIGAGVSGPVKRS